VSVAGGGPRARRRSSGVGCPCPRLGSGEARSRPSNGPILDLVAPIRPLQLRADGGYQLRFRSLEGTPNYGPRQLHCNHQYHADFDICHDLHGLIVEEHVSHLPVEVPSYIVSHEVRTTIHACLNKKASVCVCEEN
jgi:hypothetical protein